MFQVIQAGRQSPIEIKKEFFKTMQEAMEYYDVTADGHEWFWNNYSIIEINQ